MLDADNLQYLLEVARTGRVKEAAKRLGVDETTVSRKVSRLERDVGTRLFDRGVGGWALTDVGQRLVPYAESVESTILAALDATMSPRQGSLNGVVRVLTTDGFGAFVLAPYLGSVRKGHPDLHIELLTATSNDLLTGRDFDIAVTLERPSPRFVIAYRLASYDLRLYASKDYIEEHGRVRSRFDLREHTLVWYVDALLDVEPLRSLSSLLPGTRAQLQTNNIAGHYLAARSGVGIAPLPEYIGGNDDQLVPVLIDEFRAERTYWLAVPRALARLARVNVMMDAIHHAVDENPALRAVAADRLS